MCCSNRPPCERPIPLIKGKCPEGTKGIGLAGIAAGDDWRIPTQGLGKLASEWIKPSPFQGEGAPKGRMRVGLVGCGGHRTGGWGHPPLHRVTMAFVGAAVLSGPSITGAPPWSPSSVMGCAVVGSFAALRMRRTPCGCFAHATFSPAGRRLWPFCRKCSNVDGVPLIRHG